MVDTGDKVTRKYSNFRGVDFRGEDCALNRSPDALNVWRNYKKLSSIETRPGLKVALVTEGEIDAIKWHNDKLYWLSNGWIHAIGKDGVMDDLNLFIGDFPILFEFGGKLYAKGTSRFVNITDGKDVDPYVPTTTIGKKPSGGGKTHEDVNMLGGERINTFLGDGKGKEFWFDAEYIDTNYEPWVMVNGEHIPEETFIPALNPGRKYTIDYTKGKITFTDAPPAPTTDGQDNIFVRFRKTIKGYKERILKCTICQVFDNRVFFSGNPDYPSTVWHSSLNDVSYFSDLDYYVDGADQAPIRSMVAGNNALWVFREETAANDSVFYHVPTIDSDYGKIYPSSHSSIALGCAGRAINFNDDIVFFSRRGMESVSTDITTEQFATHKSSLVDRKMLLNPKYKDMILEEWEGYLLAFMGSDVYLADSRAVMTNEGHVEYEWFHWNLGEQGTVTCSTVHDGVLYIAIEWGNDENYVYALTREAKYGDERFYGYSPNGEAWGTSMHIDSYWTTPKDKFGVANKLKTTNKKGCVVEATGDVAVYAKVEDTDFELIGTNEGVDDYFVSRIKRKKFKDIQLKLQSSTSFCLESASLECFIGGYIKR